MTSTTSRSNSPVLDHLDIGPATTSTAPTADTDIAKDSPPASSWLPSPSPSPSPPPPYTTHPHPPSSIRSLLRRHCNERLFAPPLLWTSRQLELLQCHFVDREPGNHQEQDKHTRQQLPQQQPLASAGINDDDKPKEAKANPLDEEQTHSSIVRDARAVAQSPSRWHRFAAMARLMGLGPLTQDPRQCLDFRFDHSTIHVAIPCLLFTRAPPGPSSFSTPACDDDDDDADTGTDHQMQRDASSPPSSSSYPLLVWLDREPDISALRRAHFPRSNSRSNRPVAALSSIHLARATPPDARYDPYIAAVLIALAQAQHEWQRTDGAESHANGVPDTHAGAGSGSGAIAGDCAPSSCSKVFTTRLLLSDHNDKKTMQLYTAEITESFLQKLAEPSATPASASAVQIAHETVRLTPARTLQRRLFARLFPDHDLTPRRPPTQPGMKRKRPDSDEGEGKTRERARRGRGQDEVRGRRVGWLCAAPVERDVDRGHKLPTDDSE